MSQTSQLKAVIEVTKAAGQKGLSFHNKPVESLNVTRKEDGTLVSDADIAAHEVVLEGLMQLDPSIPVLSEEGGIPDYDVRRSWSSYWLVDPLDGTRGFVERSDEFTVNIALIEGNQAVLGVLYAPLSNVLYYSDGQEAFKEDQQGAHPIQTRPINWASYTILLGHLLHTRPAIEQIKSWSACTIRHMNSSYKFGLIAEGQVDAYPRLGKTSEWDTAAGQVILEAAGGAVVDFEGRPLQYNAKSSLINPSFLAVADKAAIPELIERIMMIKRGTE